MAADIKIAGDLGVQFDAGLDVTLDGQIFTSADMLKDELASRMAARAGVEVSNPLDPPLGDEFTDAMTNSDYSADDLAKVFVNLNADFSDNPIPELAEELPSIERGLVYFDKVALL